MFEVLTHINWVDLLLVAVSIRIFYIGYNSGGFVEFFKLLGVIGAIFITYHYYSSIAQFLVERTPVPLQFANILSFGSLVLIVVVIFKFLREGCVLLFKIEAQEHFEQLLGLLISVFRALLVGSLILVSLQASEIDYFKQLGKKAFLSPYFYDHSAKVYQACFDGVVSKVFPREKFNPAVFKLKK